MLKIDDFDRFHRVGYFNYQGVAIGKGQPKILVTLTFQRHELTG